MLNYTIQGVIVMILKLFSLLLLLSACSPDKESHPTTEPFSLEKISFLDLDSSQSVNLQSIFDQPASLEHVLFYFMSKGCVTCGEKLKKIRDELLTNPYFADNPKFRLVAVSTDPAALKEAVLAYRTARNFPFLQYLDSQGQEVRKHFLPDSMDRFGVPVTVMVSRSGVEWSYGNTEEYTVGELANRIRATVGPVDWQEKDHVLYDGEEVNLSTLATGTTVLTVFSELCIGCLDELKHWNAPDQPFGLCVAPSCKMLLLENGSPEEEAFGNRFPRIQGFLRDEGIPAGGLLLDPQPAAGELYKLRYFDGYLIDHFPSWEGMYGTVVFQNGRVVQDFPSGGDGLKEFLETQN